MNWNVITQSDAQRINDAAGIVAQAAPEPNATPPASGPPSTSDDYMAKLLKYVPPQIVGAYLFIEGVLKAAVGTSNRDGLRLALGILFIVGGLATVAFVARVLNVVRWKQRLVTLLAYAVWVFALGGIFGTFSWWQAAWGSLALAAFAILVVIIKMPPLPEQAIAAASA